MQEPGSSSTENLFPRLKLTNFALNRRGRARCRERFTGRTEWQFSRPVLGVAAGINRLSCWQGETANGRNQAHRARLQEQDGPSVVGVEGSEDRKSRPAILVGEPNITHRNR